MINPSETPFPTDGQPEIDPANTPEAFPEPTVRHAAAFVGQPGTPEHDLAADARRAEIEYRLSHPFRGPDTKVLTAIEEVLANKRQRNVTIPASRTTAEANHNVALLVNQLKGGESTLGQLVRAANTRAQKEGKFDGLEAIQALSARWLQCDAPRDGETWQGLLQGDASRAARVRTAEALGMWAKAAEYRLRPPLAKEAPAYPRMFMRYAKNYDIPLVLRQYLLDTTTPSEDIIMASLAEEPDTTVEKPAKVEEEPVAPVEPPVSAEVPENIPSVKAPASRAEAIAEESPPPTFAVEVDYEELKKNPALFLYHLPDYQQQIGPNDFDTARQQYELERDQEGAEEQFDRRLKEALPPGFYKQFSVGSDEDNLNARNYLDNFSEELNRQEAIKFGWKNLPERMLSGFNNRRRLIGAWKALVAPLIPRFQHDFFAKRHAISRELYRVGKGQRNPAVEALSLALTETNLRDLRWYDRPEKILGWFGDRAREESTWLKERIINDARGGVRSDNNQEARRNKVA